ncbi:hypothetical protein B0T24DRAFT_526365 [Lasiosphaeria ovina]|uniref:Mtf2-like C-terminal domain-containing protein n=1 Tax=Lasiosphaeria ovina TaxID=92902 RepID=A0AAE0NA10_9PEZI|nr:hypothetical protein B0T24DRAFT_526365 [Lasiosphaeria ovina]
MSTTLLPFLYQTRTLQRLPAAGLSAPLHFTTCFRSGRQCRGVRTRPGRPSPALKVFKPPSYLPSTRPAPVLRHDQNENEELELLSTITPDERQAFDKIFREIAARSSSALPQESSKKTKTDDAGNESPGEASSNADIEANDAVNIIFRDPASQANKSGKQNSGGFDRRHLFGSSEDPESAIARFPPVLRAAARMAMGVMEADKEADYAMNRGNLASSWELDDQELEALDIEGNSLLGKSVDIESKRREERARVSLLMKNAKTDFELWDIMESEVFSMVDRLGIGKQQPSKPGRKKKPSDDKLSMHTFGPLYPQHLHTALRLMDESFTTSSPLALNILPRVKELGLASYVLGVSTEFYNTLAWIQWYRRGDVRAVFSLFDEMRNAGLYCDGASLGIVHDIKTFFDSCSGPSSTKGPFLKELMAMPEYMYDLRPGIKHRIGLIGAHIKDSVETPVR